MKTKLIKNKPKVSILLAVVLIALCISWFSQPLVSFAASANESGTEVLQEATEIFVKYNILQGRGADTTGNLILDLDTKITRQEMAMFIARIHSGNVGAIASLSSNPMPFIDVSDPAFFNAIAYCSDIEIIKAKDSENSMYVPKGAVTVEDAVEFIVSALGYRNLDSPTGYILKADELGLFKGCADGFKDNRVHELTRGEAIILLYNFFNGDYCSIEVVFNPETTSISLLPVYSSVRDKFVNTAATLPSSSIPAAAAIETIKAYKTDKQTDDNELREFYLANQHNAGSYYHDGKYIYVNIGFGIEFEDYNIKSVELTADDGIFARQYIKRENGRIITNGVPILYAAGTALANSIVAVYGSDFEEAGNIIILEKDTITGDLLLFLVQPLSHEEFKYDNIKNIIVNFRAIVTFNDGKKQEHSITISLANSSGLGTPGSE